MRTPKNTKTVEENKAINMPKILQGRQMLQRISSSRKRVPDMVPGYNNGGIHTKPVRLINENESLYPTRNLK